MMRPIEGKVIQEAFQGVPEKNRNANVDVPLLVNELWAGIKELQLRNGDVLLQLVPFPGSEAAQGQLQIATVTQKSP